LETVGEAQGPLVTRSVRLAKAKVAGSNPVFRSNSECGFTAVFALDPASRFPAPIAGRSRVENGNTFGRIARGGGGDHLGLRYFRRRWRGGHDGGQLRQRAAQVVHVQLRIVVQRCAQVAVRCCARRRSWIKDRCRRRGPRLVALNHQTFAMIA